MRIQVRFRGLVPSDVLRQYAVRRIHLQLSRFDTEIREVIVRLSDINGPRGGVDSRCQLTVRGRRLANVFVSELSDNAHAALDMAVDRLGYAVTRALERAREARRGATKIEDNVGAPVGEAAKT